MTLTELLAFWGAVLSTIALTWNISIFFKDKAKIRVEAGIMYDVSRKEYFVVSITNIGRRPALINSVNLKEVNSIYHIFITPQELPLKLTESESHKEFYNNVDLFTREIENIWVRDSTGKDWFVNKKMINNLNKHIHNKKKE